jgi:hypothetical protein
MKRIATTLIVLGGLWACGDDGAQPQVQPPLVHSLEPATGTVGTEVRIEGSGFTSDPVVRFDDLTSPRVLQQGGALFAVAPAGLTPGRTYRVKVLNGGVSPDSSDLAFTAVAPSIDRVNGATRAEGLRGMTMILEGEAFSDSLALSQARVFFEGSDGAPVAAPIADTLKDWTDRFVVTVVPQDIPDTTRIWLETPTGASNAVEFRIIQSGFFSPSNINWTQTTALPQALHALDAVFLPVEDGPTPGRQVYVAGGIDSGGATQRAVMRARVEQSGSLEGAWEETSPLPEARAYHELALATAFNAPVDTSTTAGLMYALGGLDSLGVASASVWVGRIDLSGSVAPWESVTPLPLALHSAGAVVFGGHLWVVGGADAAGTPLNSAFRARIEPDGSLGPWQQTASLNQAASFGSLVSFGPFLYAVGGETAVVDPVSATRSGSETSQVLMARVDLRERDLDTTGWIATEALGKARSKHDAVFAGGALFVSSGIYAGQPGSSENTFADLNSDGTIRPWQGATGSETIDVEIGRSLYNHAMVSFIDGSGVGHVLVLGGADRAQAGMPSAAVLWY